MTMIYTMTGTKPEARDSTSAAEPGEVDEPRENATELRKTLSFTTWAGKTIIKPCQYGEY